MLVTFTTFVCHLWLFLRNCDCQVHEHTAAPILTVKILQPNRQSEAVGTARQYVCSKHWCLSATLHESLWL